MPSYAATVLVLRKTKLGEADTIVTLLSSEGGKIRAVAKGLRRTTSHFGARLEPYAVVDLLLHTGRSLEIVSEARTVASHALIREDLDRVTAASVVADLLDKTTSEGGEDPLLYQLALATLDAMEEAPQEALPALVAAFLFKAMSMLGLRPALSRCVQCSRAPGDGAAFSAEAGGLLCDECARTDPRSRQVSAPTREALAALFEARMEEVPALGLAAPPLSECLGLLRSFVAYHIPARLRSMEYLAEQYAQGAWPSVDPPRAVG